MKIRMMLAGAACLCAALSASATEWSYDATAKTLSDGQWTLNVSAFNKETESITISGVAKHGETSDSTKAGVLDLNSLVVSDGVGGYTEIKSVSLAQSAFANNANIVKFCCDVVGWMGNNIFSCDTDGTSKMTKLELGGPATDLPCPLLKNCTALETVKFNFPNQTKVTGSSSLFAGTETKAANLQDIDVSMVAGPGVTSFGEWTLKCQKITGDLVLTNVATLARYAFQDTKLTSVSLAGTCASLPDNVFAIVTTGLEGTITNVVLDLPNLSTFQSTAFSNQKKIRRVELVTKLANMGQLVNIVSAADNDNFNDLVVYVSTNQWKTSTAASSSIFRALTDEEKRSAPEDAFGVLVVNKRDKGVFVHKASHSDDPGDAEFIPDGMWVYSSSAKTITDGQWTLNVDALAAESTSVKILESSVIGWKEPSDASKTGILDLRSPLKVVINGATNEIKSVEFGWCVFANWHYNSDKISGFYCDILSSMGSKAFYGNQSIVDVMIGGPAETIPEDCMIDCSGVTNIVLDLPNLKSVYNSQAVELKNVHSVEIVSAFSDMGLVTNFVKSVSGTADSTGCRVYVSKRQWTKEARDAAAEAGYFAGMGTFTKEEKAKIAEDSTLARAYGVLVVGGVRKAFVVNKASPHDKIPGLTFVIW